MRNAYRLMAVVLVLVMALSVGAAAISAQDDATLVIGWEQEPQKLTPRVDMTWASLMQSLYARDVWDWDVNNELFPVMVAEVPTAETNDAGNTVVTYTLREGMQWSDGEEITSADCAFFHELNMNPELITIQRGSYPDVVESFEVVDDYTFILTYNQPYPDYLTGDYASCYLPEHVFSEMLEAEGNLDAHPYFDGEGVVGYGPYVFGEWNRGESINFETNSLWDGQTPAYSRVVLRLITETAQMVNALDVNEIDLALGWPDDQAANYGSLESVEVWNTPGVYGDAIWMNVGREQAHPALDDVNVRRAIVHAIDRGTLAEELIGPGTQVPKSWFAAQYWPEDLDFIDYNVEEANRLLDEAGWVDTNDNGIRDDGEGTELVLRFFTTTRQLRMDYQVFIQEYLADVGVQVQLLPIPSGVLFASFLERGVLDTGDWDLALFALSAPALSPFAPYLPDWFGCDGIPSAENPNGKNGWGVCLPEMDSTNQIVGTTVDVAEREELAGEVINEFFEGYHWHGLYLRPTWYAARTDVIDTSTMQDLGVLSSNWLNKIEFWQPAQ